MRSGSVENLPRLFWGCGGAPKPRAPGTIDDCSSSQTESRNDETARLFGHSSTLDWVDNGTKNFPEFLQQERKGVEPPITKSRQSQPHMNRREPASEYAASPLTVTG
ncbi:hypothetical protein I7I51_02421 [Histoplasma capsulatum]|uniref:Uncharacterized protein n=1 Tax=Ajellomyces capsulatus TaxID=5037 RepID=A0A8A1MDW2_AJECA|nr:hypothetical protein I7I51_02421 [Histoplasma capsulatum]